MERFESENMRIIVMFSAIVMLLLGLVSAGLVLAGAAFYAGWEAQRSLDHELEQLRHRAARPARAA